MSMNSYVEGFFVICVSVKYDNLKLAWHFPNFGVLETEMCWHIGLLLACYQWGAGLYVCDEKKNVHNN